MNAKDYIIIGIILLLLGSSLFYILRAKKRGEKCIGCPYAKECSKKNNSECSKK